MSKEKSKINLITELIPTYSGSIVIKRACFQAKAHSVLKWGQTQK